MKAVAIIPWRGGDKQREQNLTYVLTRLTAYGIEHVLSDSEGDTFNRAEAKNRGAEEAALQGADVFIFHDADMLLRDYSYPVLIQTAYEMPFLAIGYTEYRALSPMGTSHVLNRRGDPWTVSVAGTTVGWSLGGIIAIGAQDFWTVGGYDERFKGWGCEDTAFSIACHATLGPHERLPGVAVHLWHEHGSATQSLDDERSNAELLARYNKITRLADLRSVRNTTGD